MTEDSNAGCESSNTKKIVCISLAALVALCAGLYVCGLIFNIWPAWYQNYAPEQPIPYSHKLHAGDYKIPCLYCHGTAERSSHAEVPGLETCMNCHQAVKLDSPWIKQMAAAYAEKKPIKWVKVHVLPDFVRFNHRRHVAAGIECQSCHGPIQTMEKVYQWAPLNMGWCINCHRNNNYVQPHRVETADKVREMKGAAKPSKIEEMMANTKILAHPEYQNADISCSTCHY